MSEEPNIKIEETDAFEGDEEIIHEELKTQYNNEDLIKQNEELLKKLALAESTTIERPKKGFKKNGEPRKKAEMTEARKMAIQKMKEGRKKWLEEKKAKKEQAKPKPKVPKKIDPVIESSSEEEIIQKPKPKVKKKKKKVKKIVYEPPSESSESEEEIIVVKAPRRKKKPRVKPKVTYEDEEPAEEEELFVPDPQLYTQSSTTTQDLYGGIKFR